VTTADLRNSQSVHQASRLVAELPQPSRCYSELRNNTTLKQTVQPSWSPTAHVSQMPLNCSLCAFSCSGSNTHFISGCFTLSLRKFLMWRQVVASQSSHHSATSGADSSHICHLLQKLRTGWHEKRILPCILNFTILMTKLLAYRIRIYFIGDETIVKIFQYPLFALQYPVEIPLVC